MWCLAAKLALGFSNALHALFGQALIFFIRYLIKQAFHLECLWVIRKILQLALMLYLWHHCTMVSVQQTLISFALDSSPYDVFTG